ncbi:MAG TPA: TadG family pilus assembly protein [Candidatus Limnocylindrales bacterium]|nr:TadG family pilus assembly protein [Candidatus Limnocylindrales bacterium]
MLAVMVTFLLGGAVGLAVDAVIGYMYSVQAERAAAAAALGGVVFMPSQFSSPPVNNATDRAIAEARQNGFDVNDIADNVQVTPAQVPIPNSSPVAYYQNKLQVTVSRNVPVYFMQLLGFNSYTVSRTAVATYLPPITLGQPGGQVGSITSDLGKTGHFYFMRTEGWAVDRQQGDAFTTNPAFEYGSALNPPSTDVHQISQSAGTEPSDATLPSRGGYNYLVTIPASGGRLQVYNPVFGPDGGPNGTTGPHNNCDNFAGWTPCSGGGVGNGGNYYLHEEDSISNFNTASSYTAMRYTLYQVNNIFIRSSDVKLTQMTVYPIDATNWNATPPTYRKINGGGTVTQTYDGMGNPTNMAIYHNWVDVATYTGPNDSGLVSLNQYGVPGNYLSGQFLVGGTYRLRVDNLNYDGSISGSGSSNLSHKGYAVRVLDNTNSPCSTGCGIGAWNDMCVYTPIVGGNFQIPLFQLPPYYAGKTITVDIFDPGDISGAGTVYIDIIDPATNQPAVAPPGYTVDIYDLGVQRSNAGTLVSAPGNTTASFEATFPNGSTPYNGHWVHIELPIPSNWNPGSNPANWWWNLNYRSTLNPGAKAIDTVTVAVGLKGNPAHLLQG